jgi:hypothetical protein
MSSSASAWVLNQWPRGCVGRYWRPEEEPVVVPGEVALQAPHRLHARLAFGFLALQVCASGWVQASPSNGDDVQRSVDLPVAAAIQAMAVVSAGGDRDRRDTGEPGEVGVALEALRARGLPDQDCGSQRPAPGLGKQLCQKASD